MFGFWFFKAILLLVHCLLLNSLDDGHALGALSLTADMISGVSVGYRSCSVRLYCR
jgi:hypothetical protein